MPTGKGERERILEAKGEESERKREGEEPNSADGRRCSGKFSTVSDRVCVLFIQLTREKGKIADGKFVDGDGDGGGGDSLSGGAE